MQTLVLFDIDGTLTNTYCLDESCFLRAVSRISAITNPNTCWEAYPHATDIGILTQMFMDVYQRRPLLTETQAIENQFTQELHKSILENPTDCCEIPGANALLNELSQQPDISLGIATGGFLQSALLKLERAGINIQGLPLATTYDGIDRKAIIRKAYQRAMEYYETNFQHIVYVGDAVWDGQTCADLGIPLIGRATREKAAKLLALGAFEVVPNFRDTASCIALLREAAQSVAIPFTP